MYNTILVLLHFWKNLAKLSLNIILFTSKFFSLIFIQVLNYDLKLGGHRTYVLKWQARPLQLRIECSSDYSHRDTTLSLYFLLCWMGHFFVVGNTWGWSVIFFLIDQPWWLSLTYPKNTVFMTIINHLKGLMHHFCWISALF